MPEKRDLFNIKAITEFELHREEIQEKLEGLKEEIYRLYGFQLDFEDIYLKSPYEMILYISW